MRYFFILVLILPVWAQRTARICGVDGNAGQCREVETSRIGQLRFEDYRVTNPAAPLVNVPVRRVQLGQIPFAERGRICTADANAAWILNAPTARFNSVSAVINETETLIAGQLDQEVFGQVTVLNLILSDGLSLPQFAFRISRSRASELLVLKLNPAYLPQGVAVAEFTREYRMVVDPRTDAVSFPLGVPENAQVLRLFWSVARSLGEFLRTAEIRSTEPTPFGRELFTAAQLREFAMTMSASLLRAASPSLRPVARAECNRGPFESCPEQGEVERFAELLTRHGGEFLGTGATVPGTLLLNNLNDWAAANALERATTRNILTVLRPAMLVWPVVQAQLAPIEPVRNRVGEWLRGLRERVSAAMAEPDFRGTEVAAVRMMSAITRRDDAEFRLTVERYALALHQMRSDGSLPMEAQRGPCALTYTNRAIASLVMVAEAAAAQGYDLYSLSVDGKTLATAVGFLLDAYDNAELLARYNNPAAECELGNSAPLQRVALEVNPAVSSPAAWAEIYLARFPGAALAARLRTRLNLTGYARRPLFHELAATNTSCLFLTPQEITPLSLPLIEKFGGDDQTGPTRSLLTEALRVRVRTAGGIALGNVLVNFVVQEGAGRVEPASVLTDAAGVATARLTLGERSGRVVVRASALDGALDFRATAVGDDPKLAPGGVVGVGGSIPSVKTAAPGGILSIYGADFVPVGRGRRAALVEGRLPTMLEGICVVFGTVRAYMLDAYPGQLNIVVPRLEGTSANLRVIKGCGTANEEKTEPERVAIAAAAPEFFFFEATRTGENAVAAVDAVTGEFFGPLTILEGLAKPARPGDLVTVYLTGLGGVDPVVEPGSVAAGASRVTGNVEVRLAGRILATADVLYVGFSPGSLIYQINFRVPTGLPASNQPIEVTVNGQKTPAGSYLTLALR